MARYIDADKLKERLKIISVVADDLYGMGINRGLDRAETEIDILPEADVVEVKHSRWEKISGFYVCNICGTSPAYWESEPNNPKGYPPYCHNCGAKMDGTPKERGGEK